MKKQIKTCIWCQSKFKTAVKEAKYCSQYCLKSAVDLRNHVKKKGSALPMSQILEMHSLIDDSTEEKVPKRKRVIFVHYTSSSGRWE